jgi:putative salt-induced outer membrane protein YdiY
MKKVLWLIVVMVLLGYGISFAAGSSDLYNVKKGPTIEHRDNVLTADTVIPAVGSGLDMSNYHYAIVDVCLDGTSDSITLTPFFAASGASVYASGTSVTCTYNERLKVEVNGSQDFYVFINAFSGTGEVANIFVTGVTE